MKIACCSTLNDSYFEGFLTFFHSLLQHNPSFNYPYYIFNWGELSEQNISILNTVYSKFIFRDINNDDYLGCTYSDAWRVWDINCINRFEIFTLTDYDRIVFFDADMLVLGSLVDLFDIDVRFGACEIVKGSEIDHPSRFQSGLRSFDGGLMIISKEFINKETKQQLIDIAFQKKWTSDEPILNVFFSNDITTYLPKKYNTLIPELTPESLSDIKILQFAGIKKPWNKGNIVDRYDDFAIKRICNLSFLLKVDNLYRSYYNNAIKKYVSN